MVHTPCEQCGRYFHDQQNTCPGCGTKRKPITHVQRASSPSVAQDKYSINAVSFSPENIPQDAKYILLFDKALAGSTLQNLLRAMNDVAELGWRCISYNEYRDIDRIGSFGGIRGQALMEKND